ncbi:cytochrome C oxidase subunit I [Streptomyces sp. NPDC052016]|uniref:cytochrome C oxidase subunit I n=1 Tax=Streptomyces sp. NPDC052016 TaxID=3365680 RepID=UPI0037D3A4ED
MSDPSHREATNVDLGNEVEGYLLWQAKIMEAERRAREFVAPMEWTTTAQREEIEQRYVADSLTRARGDLEKVAARCVSLRGEYERRYRTLRLRCVAWTLATNAGFVAVAASFVLLWR